MLLTNLNENRTILFHGVRLPPAYDTGSYLKPGIRALAIILVESK